MKLPISNKYIPTLCATALLLLSACGGGGEDRGRVGAAPNAPVVSPPPPRPVTGVKQTVVAPFKSPWAMAFLPDNRLLVTDNEARSLTLVGHERVGTIAGLPDLAGIYDVAVSPRYSVDKTIYFTFAEPSPPGTPRNGPYAYADYVANPDTFLGVLALASAQLDDSQGALKLKDLKVIWRQTPHIVSGGEFGGRIAFSPDMRYIFVTAGDRAVYAPAKALDNTLGKIIRLNLDGSIPDDNPFTKTADALPEIWTLGHRNPYGLAFDTNGKLWSHEHGPKGGDEFNLIEPAKNYGWSDVSYGDHYDDSPMVKPTATDGFAPSALVWTPAIAPAGLIFYWGNEFALWKGDALITGLISQALIRVRIRDDKVTEEQRLNLGGRVREIEQGPNGSLYALIDSPNGKLVRLTPTFD